MTLKQVEKQTKKVVYLLGAGATQAEASLKDESIRIQMQDIKDGMLLAMRDRKMRGLAEVKNELANEASDVEHLITLYEYTGNKKHNRIANILKELFSTEIQIRVGKLGPNYQPRLLTALIDMHKIPDLCEDLIGIITINYEDLIERAFQLVKGGINYSVEMIGEHSRLKLNQNIEPILKLHGSFNWMNQHPLSLTDEEKMSPGDVLWIPPGVEKRRERYPFSIVWGRAREILVCDILRIIGCSLNRNDWQLISLLYTTQKLNIQRRAYLIELINYIEEGERAKGDYSYLSFRLISEIKEVREYLAKSFAVEATDSDKLSKDIVKTLSSKSNSRMNVFDTWLRSKGESMRDNGIDLTTDKNIFKRYIFNEAEAS